MKVLIACEFSGIVRDAFIKKGHDATSRDILPTENPGPHFEGDVIEILDQGWDMMIAHPPCTHLAVSGARWFKYKQKEQKEALKFVKNFVRCTNKENCFRKSSFYNQYKNLQTFTDNSAMAVWPS